MIPALAGVLAVAVGIVGLMLAVFGWPAYAEATAWRGRQRGEHRPRCGKTGSGDFAFAEAGSLEEVNLDQILRGRARAVVVRRAAHRIGAAHIDESGMFAGARPIGGGSPRPTAAVTGGRSVAVL